MSISEVVARRMSAPVSSAAGGEVGQPLPPAERGPSAGIVSDGLAVVRDWNLSWEAYRVYDERAGGYIGLIERVPLGFRILGDVHGPAWSSRLAAARDLRASFREQRAAGIQLPAGGGR